MNKDLIYLIKSIIVESIKSKGKNKFNFNFFKNLNLDEQREYANEKLIKLGSGAARDVYYFSSGKALKIAYEMFGIEQNINEYNASQKFPDLIPKVYDKDSNFKWLLVELVKPLTSESEFKKYSGVDFTVFSSLVMDLDYRNVELKNLNYDKTNLFLSKVFSYYEQGLDISDIDKLSQWGIGTDSKLKYLDPGASLNAK